MPSLHVPSVYLNRNHHLEHEKQMAFLISLVLATSLCISSVGNTSTDRELRHAMVTDEDFNCQQNRAINFHINSLLKSLIFNIQSKDHSHISAAFVF